MKQVKLGVFVALAMALSWAERLLPVSGVVPGGKLGLANIVAVIVLIKYGTASAYAVVTVRCVLGALLFGGPMSLPYSLAGGIVSLTVMYIALKIKTVGVTGATILGACAHNLAQVTVSCIIMKNIYIFSYFWPLGILSVAAGSFTGICSVICLDILKNLKQEEPK